MPYHVLHKYRQTPVFVTITSFVPKIHGSGMGKAEAYREVWAVCVSSVFIWKFHSFSKKSDTF